MTQSQRYAIAELRQMYTPDIAGKSAVTFVEPEDEQGSGNVQYYDTIDSAKAAVDVLDNEVYVTHSGESGRPEYLIVPEGTADYIASGRNSDMGNYDWDGAECECGECSKCIDMMIRQDREWIRGRAV